MDAREAKALEVTGDMRILFKNGEWLVPSQSSPSTRYKVNPSLANPSCECDDWQLRRLPCKHIAAVRLLLDRQIKGEPPPPVRAGEIRLLQLDVRYPRVVRTRH